MPFGFMCNRFLFLQLGSLLPIAVNDPLRRQDPHFSGKLEQPTPESRADPHLHRGNAFFLPHPYHRGAFAEFIKHHTDQVILKFQHHIFTVLLESVSQMYLTFWEKKE